MFGFLRIKSCGLSQQDKTLYRANFCTVCHAMREFGGLSASLLTNYDITIWLTVATALESPEQPRLKKRPCTAMPLRKVDVLAVSPSIGRTMSALNVALMGSKLEDNREDGWRWAWDGVMRITEGPQRRAHDFLLEQNYPLESLAQLARRQQQVEQLPAPTLAELSGPTEEMMSQAFGFISELTERPDQREALAEFGANLGAFIYLFDALEDFEEDQKKQTFNALAAVYGADWSRPLVRRCLTLFLTRLRQAAERLELGASRPIISSLINNLASKVEAQLPSNTSGGRLNRLQLKKAGYFSVACDGCDCGGDCCDCMDCGGGGGECCDCNICSCCDGGEPDCCNVNCCGPNCCQDEDACSISCCDPCCCICSDDCCCCEVDCCKRKKPRKMMKKLGKLRQATKGRPDEPQVQMHEQAGQQPRSGVTGIRCPGCGAAMEQTRVGSVTIDSCTDCGGIWLDDQEIEALSKLERIPKKLLGIVPRPHPPVQTPEGQRICPRCNHRLAVVDFQNIKVDACLKCRGTYLDNGELKVMLQHARQGGAQGTRRVPSGKCRYCQAPNQPGRTHCQSCGAPLSS